MSREVSLHIGLPKTGTSYLQQTLWTNKERLDSAGVHLLGTERHAQRRAVWDLLGRRIQGADDAGVAGAWQSLVNEADRSDGDHLVLSEELLVHARPKHVRKIAEALASRDLHVVVTVRDLGRAIASMWQESTTKGRTTRWTDYVAAVRDPQAGPPTAGVAFWLRYDVRRILTTWGSVVPPERIHVVIVPPAGARSTVLWERFAQATRIDGSGAVPLSQHVYSSVSAIDIEILRRLNADLRSEVSEHQYLHLAKRLRPAMRRTAPLPPLMLPVEHREWACARSQGVIDFLRRGGYDIVGGCDDLLPRWDDEAALNPDDLADADIATASLAMLSAALTTIALRAPRPRPGEPTGDCDPDARTRWLSRARSLDFRVRIRALEAADRSKVMAKFANAYLSRSKPPH